MRTTVTLDSDVEELLRNTAHERRTSFKRVLNDAVRTALKPMSVRDREAFVVEPSGMGLRSGIDPAGLHDVAADLEADAFLERTRRLEEAAGK